MATIEREMQWTLTRAANEFGCSRETLKKRLLANGIELAETYTTREICSAIYGDYDSEKTRLAKEQADKIALANAESRRELIRVEDAAEITQRFCYAIRQKFLATALSDEEKNAVLKEIERLELADLTEAPADDAETISQP